jgi:excisionase family DNA binding protein
MNEGSTMRASMTSLERTTRRDIGSADVGEHQHRNFPLLLTVDEAADLFRTTRRAIYAMVERGQLPGVIRIRRRVLFRADDLLHWLDQKRAPSSEE